MDSNSQIKRGVILSYVSIGITVLMGLFYTPWMISSIGKENYGLYTLANSVIMFFMFDFGLSSAITRFIAKYLAEGRQDKANNCLGIVYKLYFIVDILIFLILLGIFFYIPEIYQKLTQEEIEKFKIVYAIASIYSVLSFPFIPVNGILTASEKFIQLKGCEVFQKVFIVVAMSICLLCGFGLYALVIVKAVSGALTILLKVYCIRKYTGNRVNFTYFERNEFREIISFSGWTTIVSFAQRFIFTIAPTLLGIFSGSVAIAIFGVANTLEGFVWTFSTAISGMFLPMVSRIYVKGDGNILPLMTKVGRIQVYVIGLIVVGFICMGNDFVDLWVGDGFHEAFIGTVLLILPSLFFTPQEIANQAVLAQNKVKKQSIIFLLSSVFNVIVCCLLAGSLGALGICIAVSITYFIRGSLMNIVYYKDLHINVFTFFKETFAGPSVALVVSLIAGVVINQFIPYQGWLFLSLKILFFLMVYITSIVFVMNEYEKSLIIKPIKDLIQKIIKV